MILEILQPCRVVAYVEEPIKSVEIKRGKEIYYLRDDFKPNQYCFQFNMTHTGKFISNVNFKFRIDPLKPFESNIDLLPKRQKNLEDFEPQFPLITNYKLIGKTPARIDTSTGRIEVSPEFWKYAVPIREFIIWHEIGHQYYFDEEKCDTFALKMFLENGGNPSNAFYSLTKVFKHPEFQVERIYNLYKNLPKTENYL